MSKQLHQMSQLDLIKIIDEKDAFIEVLKQTVVERNTTIDTRNTTIRYQTDIITSLNAEIASIEEIYNDLKNETMHQT